MGVHFDLSGLILICLLSFVHLSASTFSPSKCPLFWDSRQNLGYDQGVQLQVCCNVTKTRIYGFSSAQNFELSPNVVYEQEMGSSQDNFWSELQLSICSDRDKPTIGWVEGKYPGVKCEYRSGQTLNVPPSLLPLPNWYILCYDQPGGCQTCRLDAVCDNDLSQECADVFLLGSSPSATNHSIRYWIAVGRNFPFEKSSHVELTVRVQRTGKLVKTEKLTPIAGKKQTIELSGLSPNEVYNVERCMVIKLPSTLLANPRLSFVNDTARLCDEEGYRTLPNSASLPSLIFIVLSTFLFSFFHS